METAGNVTMITNQTQGLDAMAASMAAVRSIYMSEDRRRENRFQKLTGKIFIS